MPPSRRLPKPTPAELDLLRTLWRLGPATVKQVHETRQRERPDLTYATMSTREGLGDVAAYADAVGVETGMILPRDATGRSLTPTSLVVEAHTAGLKVVVWTFRAENAFLPLERRHGDAPADHGDLNGYLQTFYALGVDAVFSDFPGIAVAAR